MSVSAAKSRLMQAKMQLDSNRKSDAEATIEAGLKFLDGQPENEAAPVRAQLEELLAQISGGPKEEDLRNVSAAKGKIRQAQSELDAKQTMGTEGTLGAAERYLASVPEALKAPVMGEIAALRAQLKAATASAAPPRASGAAPERASGAAPERASGAAPTPMSPPPRASGAAPERSSGAAPAPVAPPPRASGATAAPAAAAAPAPAASAPAMSDEDYTNVSRAKSRLMQAKSLLETGRTDMIEGILSAALEFIANVPAAARAPIEAEVAAIRAKTGGAVDAEKTRRISDELRRRFSGADSFINMVAPERALTDIAAVEARLQDEEVKSALGADGVAEVAAKVADHRKRLVAAVKEDALQRARPLLAELEGLVVEDPFAGKEPMEANGAMGEIERLKLRTRDKLRAALEADPELAAIEEKIRAIEQKVDACSIAYGKAQQDAAVENSWSSIAELIAGWEEESSPVNARHLYAPELPKTYLAKSRVGWLLDDPTTKKLRAENPDDPKIVSTYANAERIYQAAVKKIDAAYAALLDEAEKLPTPSNDIELGQAVLLASSLESMQRDTGVGAANAARARALDAKWQADRAAQAQARAERFKKACAEAEKAWPAIEASIPAVPFDESNIVKGQTVLLNGVHNRMGWDYASRKFDFGCLVGETVVCGAFEPNINDAIEDICHVVDAGFSDRMPWDVVGVVVGQDMVGERTQVILRDKFTNFEIGREEQWPNILCTRIKIIALHASTIAVGPA